MGRRPGRPQRLNQGTKAGKAGKSGRAPREAPATRRTSSAGHTPGARRSTTLGGEQVEGRQAVRELLLAGTRRVREVLVAAGDDGRVDRGLLDIVELAGDLRVPVKQVSRSRLDAAARTDAAQGVVAHAAPLPEADLDDLLVTPTPSGEAPFLVAVDGVTDPGNLGALLRSAECAGVSGVVLPRHRAVHVTPAAAKAAAGAVEHVPIAIVSGLPSALERAKAGGVWVVGLDARGDTPVHQVPFAADPLLLVLGAEGAGLSRLVRQRCDVVASIPLRGRLESLNVAAAAAIATYAIAAARATPTT